MQGRFDYSQDKELVRLDVKDQKLLDLLIEDSRTPVTQLAKKIRLSRDAVQYRIDKLIVKGVILGFAPQIHYEKLGYYLFHVFFLLDERKQQQKKDFVTYLKKHPAIFGAIEYSDRWDFEVMMVAKNLLEFDDLLLDISSEFSDVILERDKIEIIRRFNSDVASTFTQKTNAISPTVLTRGELVALDDTDRKLLELLCKDCRESSYVLAQALGVSSDTVLYRLKQLKKKGVIRKFTVMLDLSVLGKQWHTFTLGTTFFDKKDEAKFEEFLRQHPQIIRSAKALGGWDVIMYLVTSTHKEFHQLAFDIKRTFSDHVREYDSWSAYKEHFYKPFLPLFLKP